MLIPPAVIGLMVFCRGLIGFGGFGWIDDSPTALALCEDQRVLCPRCDGPAKQCKFEPIRNDFEFDILILNFI